MRLSYLKLKPIQPPHAQHSHTIDQENLRLQDTVQEFKISGKGRPNVALNQKRRFDFIIQSNC